MNDLGTLALLQINDLKSIDVVEIPLNEKGQFVTLKGNNGVGKSTVMEAIETLFNGGTLPNGLIRNGKSEAIVCGEFSSGYTATRRIRKNKKGEQVNTLVVVRPDGGKVGSPQTVLREIFAGYMNPSRLASMSGAPLYNEIAKQIPAEVQKLQDELDDALEEKRNETAVRKSLGEVSPPSEEKPEGAVVFDEERYFQLQDLVTECQEHINLEARLEAENRSYETQIAALQLKIADNDLNIKSAQLKAKNFDVFNDELGAMKEARDMSAHSAALIKEWETYQEWYDKTDELDSKIHVLGMKIKSSRDHIRKAISESVPVEGMEISEDKEITMHKIPWDNCAFSERLEAAALLQIKALPDWALPIMFIEHGESMNKEKRERIASMAIKAGATVFMEVMNEDVNELTIEYNDVQVKATPIPEPKEADRPPVPGMVKASEIPVPETPSIPPPKPVIESSGTTEYDDAELDIF